MLFTSAARVSSWAPSPLYATLSNDPSFDPRSPQKRAGNPLSSHLSTQTWPRTILMQKTAVIHWSFEKMTRGPLSCEGRWWYRPQTLGFPA